MVFLKTTPSSIWAKLFISKKQIKKGERMKKAFISLLVVVFLIIGIFAIVGKAFEEIPFQKIFIISIVAVIILAAVAILSFLRKPRIREEVPPLKSKPIEPEGAGGLEALRKRYVEREITSEEYEKIKSILETEGPRGKVPPHAPPDDA